MTRYGVRDDGSFRRKHVDEIRDDSYNHFESVVGRDVELNAGSPQTAPLDAFAIEMGRLWAALEETYHASFYEDSFGSQVDKHLAIANFERLQLRPATGEVVFSRDDPAPDDITIPEGTVVQTPRTEPRPPIPFETTEPARIDEGETESGLVPIEALKPWQTELEEEWLGEETNVASDTVTRFQSPVSGVDEVTNPNATGDAEYGYQRGRDRETDPEYKLRYQNELGADGNATLWAIEASVFNADPDVASVSVDERHDTDANEYGVEVTVLAPGVPDDVIADAIFFAKGGGLDTFGSESGATEWGGKTRIEHFDRATEVGVYVDAELHTTDSFPSDAETEIEDALVEYIGGEDNDGTSYTGLRIGEDVVYDQLIKRIVQVQGVIEVDLEIGTDPTDLNEANIEIDDDEAAVVALENIDLTET